MTHHDAPPNKIWSKFSAIFADSQVHRIPRMIDQIYFVCGSLALLYGLSAFVIENHQLMQLLFVLLSVVTLLASRRYVWFGALGSMAVMLLAATAGLDPILFWTITVFLVSSATLRGFNIFILGILGAMSSFASCLIAYGYTSSTHEGLIFVAVSLAMAGLSSAVHSYFRYRQEQEQRLRDAGAKRVAEINQKVANERLQIARDLHDLVGHEIAMLGIHLGVAEVNTPPESRQAHESLAAARANVQSVLAETQQILQVLRSNDNLAEASGLTTASLDAVKHLVESARVAGLTVRADLVSVPEQLNPEVSTAAYRIVQEALTNAQRYGVGSVDVRTTFKDQQLIITVRNEKSAEPHPAETSGLGLVGMRERTESAGGTLEITDLPKTFTVTATFPTTIGAE